MYNRYAPQDNYRPAEPQPCQGACNPANNGQSRGRNPGSSPFSLLDGLFGGTKNAGGAGILERLGLGKLDSGDILLLLILFYLFRETEDEEWLMILALMMFMGLGD